MSLPRTVSFNVKVVGDVTGKVFEGLFEAKTSLSMTDQLKESEVVRRLLGYNSQDAEHEDKLKAKAIAYLAMRVTKAPQCWKDVEGGHTLEDLNVLAVVNNAAQAAIAAEYEKLAVEAEKAQPILKEQLDKV